MMLYLIYGDYTLSSHYLKVAVETGLGIAVGIVLFGIFVKLAFYITKLIKKTKKQRL